MEELKNILVCILILVWFFAPWLIATEYHGKYSNSKLLGIGLLIWILFNAFWLSMFRGP